METMKPRTDTKPVAPTLPLDVAAALLGSKWETPLNELRPRTN